MDFLKNFKRGGGKGVHSSVFVVLDEAEREQKFVIKFCNYPVRKQGDSFIAVNGKKQILVDRFFHEIDALKKVARSEWASKAIKIVSAGVMNFQNFDNEDLEDSVLWVATELAETDLSISVVSERVGYSSPFALSTAFKRARGVSPREHRVASA